MTNMNKKILPLFPLIISLGLVVAFCVSCSETTRSEEPSNPERLKNIILISIDTLRADHLSCYGYEKKTSPNIDNFAKESVLFQKATTQAPHTAPAHMSIFTGLTPVTHNVKNHEQDGGYKRLSNDVLTLTEILKKNGYMTAGFTGGGNISGDLGFDRGFDKYTSEAIDWENVQNNPSELDEIRKWIKSSKEEEQPLFLFLHNHICHDPYLRAPDEFRLKFLEKRVAELPISNDDIMTGQGFNAKRSSFWANVDFKDPDHIAHMVALYDGGISYMDYVFGETIKVLKEEGIFDDSIIILLSDHGEEFYEHQTYLHGYLFAETMHVPLIMKFPQGKYGGTNIQNLVRTMDLMPTLFESLGIRSTNFTQGVSFMPLLGGKGKYDPVILSYDGMLKAVRFQENGFFYSNQPSPGGSEWLFDLENDPKETQNLAAEKPEILTGMRAKAKRLIESDRHLRKKHGHGQETIRKADRKTLDQLKNLGYLQ